MTEDKHHYYNSQNDELKTTIVRIVKKYQDISIKEIQCLIFLFDEKTCEKYNYKATGIQYIASARGYVHSKEIEEAINDLKGDYLVKNRNKLKYIKDYHPSNVHINKKETILNKIINKYKNKSKEKLLEDIKNHKKVKNKNKYTPILENC